jgi:hypothetical protein
MSHTDIGIVGATTDSFILFENGVRRNRLVLPGLSNVGGSHDVQARPAHSRPRAVVFCSPSKIHAARASFTMDSAASVNSRERRGAQNSAQSSISLRRFSSLAPR